MDTYPPALFSLLEKDLARYLPVKGNRRVTDFEHKVQSVQAIRLLDCAFKKLEASRNAETKKQAVDTFKKVNKRCQSFTLGFAPGEEELLIGNLRDVLYRFFFRTGDDTIFDCTTENLDLGVGPGVSHGSEGSDVYTKLFNGPIAGTSDALCACYTTLCTRDHRWLDAEIRRTYDHGNPVATKTSRLSTVPKDETTDRVIMIEPAINMLFQLAFGRKIEERLDAYFGINLSRQQSYNRRLALIGSKTGSCATIDLKSASDSLSLGLCKAVLPKRVLTALARVRSPSTLIDGVKHRLHMIGTMGNGFTFPLQTALFAACVRAVGITYGYQLWDPSPDRTGNWGVFGDDIIVPVSLAGAVMRLLGLLGFVVNSDKTFVEGPFRESCGLDAFQGVDVRPVFIRRLAQPQDRYIAINKLTQWCAKTSIPLPLTLGFLMKGVKHLFIPPHEAPFAGIQVPSAFFDKKLKGNVLYRCYEPRISKLKFLKEDLDMTIRLEHKQPVNRAGLELAALFGAVSSTFSGEAMSGYAISTRQDGELRYRSRQRVTPNWDYFPTLIGVDRVPISLDPLGQEERRRWNAMVPYLIR